MNEIKQLIPEQWRGPAHLLAVPLLWLIPFQYVFLDAAWNSESSGLVLLKRIFLALPAVAILAGLWCTFLAAYTLPFRSSRLKVVGAFLVLWWDVARSTWLFWGGMARFLWVAVGALWGLLLLILKTAMEVTREAFELPFMLTGTITKNLSQPGVPWIAFLITVAWSFLEATVFTYVLSPTMTEIMSNLTGSESHRFLGIFLFLFLLVMVAGSFMCMHVLLESFSTKRYTQILQMLTVEFFVMFVEVMFLYRELVDALTPWIAQQTGMQMGIVPVILLATFSWMGIRGMTWFLFARYGTPMLLALISRQRLPEEAAETATASAAVSEERWGKTVGKLKAEQAWFQQKAQELLEAAILPSFQVLASAINFGTLLFLSEPLFSLPFKSLADVAETRELLQSLMTSEPVARARK